MNRRSFLQSIAACVAAVGADRVGKAAPAELEPEAPSHPVRSGSWVSVGGTVHPLHTKIIGVRNFGGNFVVYETSPTTTEGGK